MVSSSIQRELTYSEQFFGPKLSGLFYVTHREHKGFTNFNPFVNQFTDYLITRCFQPDAKICYRVNE